MWFKILYRTCNDKVNTKNDLRKAYEKIEYLKSVKENNIKYSDDSFSSEDYKILNQMNHLI